MKGSIGIFRALVTLTLLFNNLSFQWHVVAKRKGFPPSKSSVDVEDEDTTLKVKDALRSHSDGLFLRAISQYKAVVPFLTGDLQSQISNNLGVLQMQELKFQEAHDSFEVAIKARKKNSSAHFNLALLLASKMSEHRTAWRHCARAIQLDPNNENSLHLMGIILREMKYCSESEKYFNAAESMAAAGYVGATSEYSRISGMRLFNTKSGTTLSATVDNESYTMVCISERPLIFVIPALMIASECAHIRQRAQRGSTFEASTTRANTDTPSTSSSPTTSSTSYRSSSTAWLSNNDDDVLSRLQARVAALTGLPLEHLLGQSEDLQVVRYEIGGRFRVHHDASAFHARFMTTLLYLNTLEEGSGGETWFPYATPSSGTSGDEGSRAETEVKGVLNKGSDSAPSATTGPSSSKRHCPSSVDAAIAEALAHYDRDGEEGGGLTGTKITPVLGSAVLFFNYLPEGGLDPSAVHAGLPVTVSTPAASPSASASALWEADDVSSDGSAQKWIANYWLGLDLAGLDRSLEAHFASSSTISG